MRVTAEGTTASDIPPATVLLPYYPTTEPPFHLTAPDRSEITQPRITAPSLYLRKPMAERIKGHHYPNPDQVNHW